MNEKELYEYRKEFNKETYKTVKVYIRKEEYPEIVEHAEKQGYKKMSGYINDLIRKDMADSGLQGGALRQESDNF